jgi:hypothetical protein
MEVKKIVLERGRFKVQDDTQTIFWEDLWFEKEPLKEKYSTRYNIVKKKNVSVAQVLSIAPLNISFKRALVGDNWDKWLSLVGSICMVHLNDHKDSFSCTANKIFSLKNMYNDLVLKSGTPVNCCTSKANIHLKIKIFLWYHKNGVVLTMDNSVKRQWKWCIKCCFLRSMKQFNTYFFIIPWLDLCGGLSVLHLALQNQWVWRIFLVLGSEVFRASQRTLC